MKGRSYEGEEGMFFEQVEWEDKKRKAKGEDMNQRNNRN